MGASLLAGLLVSQAGAAGVLAGTTLVNQATFEGQQGAQRLEVLSVPVEAVVAHVPAVSVTPSGRPALVSWAAPGSEAQAAFTLLNPSNGPDRYALAAVGAPGVSIRLDDGDGRYGPEDQVVTALDLGPDASALLWLVGTAPVSGQLDIDLQASGRSGVSDTGNIWSLRAQQRFAVTFAPDIDVTLGDGERRVLSQQLENVGSAPLLTELQWLVGELAAAPTDPAPTDPAPDPTGPTWSLRYRVGGGAWQPDAPAAMAAWQQLGTPLLPGERLALETEVVAPQGAAPATGRYRSAVRLQRTPGPEVLIAPDPAPTQLTVHSAPGEANVLKSALLCGESCDVTSPVGADVAPGELMRYVVEVRSAGQGSLFAPVLRDPLPTGVALKQATGRWSGPGQLLLSADGLNWVPLSVGLIAGTPEVWLGLDRSGDGVIDRRDLLRPGESFELLLDVEVR